jgi:hypothetical protein
MISNKNLFCLLTLVSFFVFVKINAEQRTIKILCIGNSFTVDAFEAHLAPLASADNVELVLGYPYKGGTRMDQHRHYVENNDSVYNYRKIVNGKLSKTDNANLLHVIKDENWDYVIFQTNHQTGGFFYSYFPYLISLMEYVKTNISNPDVIFGLYMCWAYDSTSTYTGFDLYDKNQLKMYESIVDCTWRVAKTVGIELIIPVGTAIQNGRCTSIGDNFNRDGYHLNYDWGRYTASCAWYEKITGKTVVGNPYYPQSMTPQQAYLCQISAHLAIINPQKITRISENTGD